MFWLIIISIFIFTLRAVIFFIGSLKERSKKLLHNSKEYQPKVSVIIPARNEEDKIENCIHTLMKSDYPNNSFEVVAVNDRSIDKTGSVLNSLKNQYSNLKVVHIKDDADKLNLRGKPGALHKGISSSDGEIVLMTDADCEVNNHWISSVVRRFADSKVGLVPSYTLIKHSSTFDMIQAVEWIYMHTMASAGVGLNNPLGCYGNNLSIRRNVYNQIGGYPNIKFSVTEDLALLKSVFSAGYRVNYICDYSSTVTTLPCSSLKEYLLQRKRWAVGGMDLGYSAVFFVATSLIVWIGLIIAIIAGKPLWILAILFARILGDYILIQPVINILKQYKLNSMIIPSIAFFMLMEIIVPPMLIDSRIEWKGQIFNKRS